MTSNVYLSFFPSSPLDFEILLGSNDLTYFIMRILYTVEFDILYTR